MTLVKRFQVETSSLDQRFPFITEHKDSKLFYASVAEQPEVTVKYREKNQTHEKQLDLTEFIDVKGWKSLGNKLTDQKLTSVKEKKPAKATPKAKANGESNGKLRPGDSLELDL